MRLNIGQMRTKADDGYADATEEEKTINTCYVVVFDKNAAEDETEIISITLFTELTPEDHPESVIPEPGDPMDMHYTLEGILVRHTDTRIMVIANTALELDDEEAYAEYDTYEKFKELVETTISNEEYAFEADNLVKIGEIEKTFPLTDKNEVIEIPLTQLAAKVDFVFTSELIEEFTPRQYTYLAYQQHVNMKNIKQPGGKNPSEGEEPVMVDGEHLKIDGEPMYMKWWHINNRESLWSVIPPRDAKGNPIQYMYIWNGVTYYFDCVTLGNTEPKAVFVDGEVLESRYTETKYVVEVPTAYVDNIETKSYLLENELMKSEERSNERIWDEASLLQNKEIIAEQGINGEYIFTFYTYEKPHYTIAKNELNVIINTRWDYGTTEYIEQYKVNGAGIWLKKAVDDKSAPTIADGWGDTGYFTIVAPVIKDDIDIPAWANNPEFKSEYGEGGQRAVDYKFPINPKEGVGGSTTDGVVRGNYYHGEYVFKDIPNALKSSTDFTLDFSWVNFTW